MKPGYTVDKNAAILDLHSKTARSPSSESSRAAVCVLPEQAEQAEL